MSLDDVARKRMEFYNQYGVAVQASAVEAIFEAVHEHAGITCDVETKQKVADILGTTFKNMDVGTDFEALRMPTTRLILLEIGTAAKFEPTDELIKVIYAEVHRSIRNMLDGFHDFYKSAMIDSGADPNDPIFRPKPN